MHKNLKCLSLLLVTLSGLGCSAGDPTAPPEASQDVGGSAGSVAAAGTTASSGGSGGSGGHSGASNTSGSGGVAGSSAGSAGTSAGQGGTGSGAGGETGIGGHEPGGTPPDLTPGVWQDISPERPDGWDVWGVRVDPNNTAYLYAAMCAAGSGLPGGGVWRSTDAGSSWGEFSLPGCATGVAVDPNDPLHAYVSYALFAGDKGNFWVTTDGGSTWSEKDLTYSADVGRFGVDPNDFDHILLSFHYVSNDAAGIIESTDGGESWAPPAMAPWGYGGTKSMHFLGDAQTWMIGSEGGFFRTSNGGDTFDAVAEGFSGTHGGGDTTYFASDGSLYVPTYPAPMRSTDNGLTWASANMGLGNAGYYRVLMGDGNTLYTAPEAGGSIGMATATEGGVPSWTWGDPMTFPYGPSSMDFDPVERILYIGQKQPGVWALKVEEP